MIVGLDEGLLRDIEGIFKIPDNPQHHRMDPLLVALDEFTIGIHVAADSALNEFEILHSNI